MSKRKAHDDKSQPDKPHGPLASAKEAGAFLSSGAAAVVEFFAGEKEHAEDTKVHDRGADDEGLLPKLDDFVEGVARKISPFPGQEG